MALAANPKLSGRPVTAGGEVPAGAAAEEPHDRTEGGLSARASRAVMTTMRPRTMIAMGMSTQLPHTTSAKPPTVERTAEAMIMMATRRSAPALSTSSSRGGTVPAAYR